MFLRMPQLLTPDRFTLLIERGAPVITLHGVSVSAGDGWSFLNRATLLVVDGPGDEGFLLPRMITEGDDLAPEGWDTAVAGTGSVTIVGPGARFTVKVIE
jgi:hypothetical protein